MNRLIRWALVVLLVVGGAWIIEGRNSKSDNIYALVNVLGEEVKLTLVQAGLADGQTDPYSTNVDMRSEEHTSELQSR